MKKLRIFFAITLIIGLLSAMIIPVSAVDTIVSGKWGSLSWELNHTTGHLTISGKGDMLNLGPGISNAWKAYKDSIKTVTVEEGVKSIGIYAFQECKALTAITLPSTLTYIDTFAFQLCSNLTGIVIPSGVTGIGEYVFSGCAKLESILLPSTMTRIGTHAFNVCESLTDLFYCGTEQQWSAVEKGSYWNYGTGRYTLQYHKYEPNTLGEKVCVGCGDTIEDKDHVFSSTHEGITWKFNDVTLHLVISGNGEVKTGHSIFGAWSWEWDRYKNAARTVTIEEGVTSIGEKAFYWGANLEHVDISSGVTKIGEYAFYECHKLKSITIPSNVTSIDDWAFHQCDDLQVVRFLGTPDEWARVTVGYGNQALMDALQFGDHTYGSWEKHDQSQHKRICDCGEVVYANHTDGKWEKHDGKQHKRICSDCGEVQYEDHNWRRNEEEGGGPSYVCSACGATPTLSSGCMTVSGGSALSIALIGLSAGWVAMKKKKSEIED